jgi:NADH-quinone oxidoreductase subunit N
MEIGYTPLVLIGTAMLLIGFGFKVATVPFHMWAPDVYDGSPAPITAFMAATVKAAAFAAFFRVWNEAFGNTFPVWYPAVHLLAVATMIGGNAIGLAQRSLKRLLAYSSIGHAGYMLVAVAAASPYAGSAILFYLLIYTFATFGAFAVLSSVARPNAGTVSIDELAGLWRVRPWMALGMGVIMLALLGFPVFGGAGFFAKWYILQAALRAPVPLVVLSVVLVLTTVVSAGYYLHVVMVMFMRPRAEGAAEIRPMSAIPRAVLAASVAVILGLGLFPEYVVRKTMRAYPEFGLGPPRSSSIQELPEGAGGQPPGPVAGLSR